MNSYAAREAAVALLETALVNAGMQDKFGVDTSKPYFFRLAIPEEHSKDAIVMRYQITGESDIRADDVRAIYGTYVNATLFANSCEGVEASAVPDLIDDIERECHALNIGVNVSSESAGQVFGDATSESQYVIFEFFISTTNVA